MHATRAALGVASREAAVHRHHRCAALPPYAACLPRAEPAELPPPCLPAQDTHEIVYQSDNVKEVLDLKKNEWKHVVKLVKTAYRGTLVRASDASDLSDETPNPMLLVHFDGYAFEDEASECWVDEVREARMMLHSPPCLGY